MKEVCIKQENQTFYIKLKFNMNRDLRYRSNYFTNLKTTFIKINYLGFHDSLTKKTRIRSIRVNKRDS